MADDAYEEDLRLVGTCPTCKSDRIYVTQPLAGLGMPSIVAVECAACKEARRVMERLQGAGHGHQVGRLEGVVATEFAVSDSEHDHK